MQDRINKVQEFFTEINNTTSIKEKLSILKSYNKNEDIKNIIIHAYDKVNFNYNLSGLRVLENSDQESNLSTPIDGELDNIFETLGMLRSGDFRGNSGLNITTKLYNSLSDFSRTLLINILNHDLRIGMNTKNISKVFPDAITKVKYCRCDIFNEKTIKNINFPAYLQIKMDGTYREATVSPTGEVILKTRSGEDYTNKTLEAELSLLEPGVYFGELTIPDIPVRAQANGLINSDNPPENDIIFTVWDYVTPQEYRDPKSSVGYGKRFSTLTNILNKSGLPVNGHIQLIKNAMVFTIEDVMGLTSRWIKEGLEGSVLKDISMKFKDGTSKQQLKIKAIMDADLRITGFEEGTRGTKREGLIGAICFESDDGKIKGKCSGFDDTQLVEFSNNRDSLIGKIITVEFNGLTKAKNNDYYALMHPRFIEIRDDKTTTDTLERVSSMIKE